MEKVIIGRVEKISFPELGIKNIHAKIDTGADLSSLWASEIHEDNGTLVFKLFGRGSDYYTGKEIRFHKPDYLVTRISSSFGHKEIRFVVKLQIKLGGKLITGTFSLADRSHKTYPILIGRKLLNRKFLVDVSKGSPLKDLEAKKKSQMKKELDMIKLWEKKR